jgi:hypothetical protein
MTFRHKKILPLLALLALALALPAAAGAKTHVQVGLGDQQPLMFADKNFRALKIKKVRYFIRWDAIRKKSALAAADAYVDAARGARQRVLLHVSTNDLRKKRAKLPSVRAYKRDVGRLVRHFRARGVREFGVWNEANHYSQPTYRNAKRAAQYYRAMRGFCRGCTIVALDVLDQRGVAGYVNRWYRALPRGYRSRRLIVGIHNYSDTNRHRSRGTQSIITTVRRNNRRARFWLTETGGVVNFGRAFKCSTRRAARSISYMFKLAKRFDRYVERLYAYNWTGADCRGFDAGLVSHTGKIRPGYRTFKSRARSFTR